MDTELLDLISRTRPTILEILTDRGYNVESYRDQSPDELTKMAITSPTLLNITAHSSEMEGEAEAKRARVLYWMEGTSVRLRLENLLHAMWEGEEQVYDPKRDEVIVILSEPFHEIFHLQAAKLWNRLKARISFFNIKNLVSNPRHHVAVPPHRKLNAEEAEKVMTRYHIRSKSEFPKIVYHVDMQARVLGLVPGDLVEIRRPSPTSGEYVFYRVCAT
jgi:DNA-directed RNA polymerase subunit H